MAKKGKASKSKSKKKSYKKSKAPAPVVPPASNAKKGTPQPTVVCVGLDCNKRPTNPTGNSGIPKTGGANVIAACTDLENCNRPTNPTSKKGPQSPTPPPKVGGASAATAPSPGFQQNNLQPTSVKAVEYAYSDCDDLDNCNRPTNPTTNDKFRSFRAYDRMKNGDGDGRCRGLSTRVQVSVLIVFLFTGIWGEIF